ncbi:MAG: hypothetical protein AAFY52_02060 [Pseudomonadota bacterium]
MVSYHDTRHTDAPATLSDPPSRDWKTVYDQAAQRVPDLGLYPITDPSEDGAGKLMTGDAIDDIADITLDLRETLWLANVHGDAHADAFFQDHCFHWGRHARQLLLYMHSRLEAWQNPATSTDQKCIE